MTNSLKVAAQAGDVKALEALMNKAFEPRRINVNVTNRGSTLKILLSCPGKPDPQLKAFVKRGLQSINPKGFEEIWITATVINGGTAWEEKISWSDFGNTSISTEVVNGDSSENRANPDPELVNKNMSSDNSTTQDQKSSEMHDHRNTRKAYQFLQIRVQLLGRGITNELMTLYVNGKKLTPKVRTLHEFLNFLGMQGFQVATASMETEGVYTHFYTLQREVFTYDAPDEDVYTTLEGIGEGASFGDSVRNAFEFGLFDNF